MNKKYKFILFALFISNASLANTINTIVAVINDDIVTLKELNKFVSFKKINKEEGINVLVDLKIKTMIAKKLNIIPNEMLVNRNILNISEKLNIPIEVILADKNYSNIKEDIYSRLTIELLKKEFLKNIPKFISEKDLENTELSNKLKQIFSDPTFADSLSANEKNIAFDIWIKKIRNETYIETFKEKII